MDIPEVKEFFRLGEVAALSREKIRIGILQLTRHDVQSFLNDDQSWRNRPHGRVRWWNDAPYWVTKEDCQCLIAEMDRYEELHKPKFKVGQWVWCVSDSHSGPNPFKIESSGQYSGPEDNVMLYYHIDGTSGLHLNSGEGLSGCREEWLEAVPAPGVKEFFKVGDLVLMENGRQVRLACLALPVCVTTNREEWRVVSDEFARTYLSPVKDRILERDGRKPTWGPGTYVRSDLGREVRLVRFIGFPGGTQVEEWDVFDLQSTSAIPNQYLGRDGWQVIPDPTQDQQLARIDQGIRDADAGRVVAHEEVKSSLAISYWERLQGGDKSGVYLRPAVLELLSRIEKIEWAVRGDLRIADIARGLREAKAEDKARISAAKS